MPLVKSGWRVAATPAQSPRGRRLSAGRFSVVMIHVLGIDAGGTKTVCQLADEQGTLVSEARAGGANLQAAGELHVEKVIHDVMEEAIGDRDIVPAAICLGIAGVDRAEDSTIVRGLMRRIGFKARTLVVNDALVALEAGAPGAPGVVIISGTGSIAYGRNQQNQGARAGGWGHVLGDEGSGYWIGRAALRAVLREADRRGPRTALTPLLLRHFGVSEAQNLIHEVYQSKLRPAAIGALAQCVQAAFTEGDDAAQGILRAAADELESSGSSVATTPSAWRVAVHVHPRGRHLPRGTVAARRDADSAGAEVSNERGAPAGSRTGRRCRLAGTAGSARRRPHSGLHHRVIMQLAGQAP